MTKGPLSGLLVVSVEQAVAAPFCSSRLADAGARVLKIERPDGDFARNYDTVVNGGSAYFLWLNRGKESVCVDLKSDTDRVALHAMIRQADIFIQNLAPGAAARYGFGSEQLRKALPRLITVDISGYGESGPYADMKAYDLLIQAESALASITGSPTEPARVGVSICDIACGMYAYSAVLEALLARKCSSTGCAIKISLFDSIAEWMTVPLLHFEYSGKPPPRMGLHHPSIAPYGAYLASDGNALLLAVQNEQEWKSFCKNVLDNPGLAGLPEFASNSLRVANRMMLDELIRAEFAKLPRQLLTNRMKKGHIAFGMLNSLADLSRHSQLRRTTVDSEIGEVALVSPPAMVSGSVTRLDPVPSLGEHTARVFEEFMIQS